jgi:2,3-dihydroxybenzoate decarboxylase
MDKEGIDVQLLSLTSPGIQSIADPKEAVASAKKANDSWPTSWPSTRPASRPWRRCRGSAPRRATTRWSGRRQLGAVGVMLNGHTKGAYMDEERFRPVWERIEALGVPVYLHPIQAVETWKNCEGYPELTQAAWGWAFETGTHFWRLVLSGLFDAHPGLTVILGHMGEFVPFGMWRFDDRYEWIAQSRGLVHEPSYYAKHNLMVTTSGCAPTRRSPARRSLSDRTTSCSRSTIPTSSNSRRSTGSSRCRSATATGRQSAMAMPSGSFVSRRRLTPPRQSDRPVTRKQAGPPGAQAQP